MFNSFCSCSPSQGLPFPHYPQSSPVPLMPEWKRDWNLIQSHSKLGSPIDTHSPHAWPMETHAHKNMKTHILWAWTCCQEIKRYWIRVQAQTFPPHHQASHGEKQSGYLACSLPSLRLHTLINGRNLQRNGTCSGNSTQLCIQQRASLFQGAPLCEHMFHLWKHLFWPPSPLPHPVPAVTQQLGLT